MYELAVIEARPGSAFRKIIKAGAAVLFATFAFFTAPPAQADERRTVTVEGADYFGADFQTLKEIDLEACKAACLANDMCRAFTYNVSARWCFLKSDIGDLRAFDGAIAGRVVEIRDVAGVSLDEREGELAFVPQPFIEEAKRLSRRLPREYEPANATLTDLSASARAAMSAQDYKAAQRTFGQALALEPAAFDLWAGFTASLIAQNPQNWQEQNEVNELGSSAAINAYLRSRSDTERALALDLIGTALSKRQAWKPVIKAWRQALTLDDRSGLRERYDRMVAEHGFRILNHQVDSDAATPRICVVFSETLPRGSDMTPFVKVTGEGPFAVESEGAQVCIDGVAHGRRYGILVREGLPSAEGEKLLKSADLSVYVRDREPSVRFLGRSYVLPAGEGATIPVVSVNTQEVEAEIYRIGDRALASALRDRKFLAQLNSYQADQIRSDYGEAVWKGVVEVERDLNKDVTTAIPLADIGIEPKPGVYAMTARAGTDVKNQWGPWATQWFIVSDLGLTSYSGSDGLTASVRSLATAKAVVKASVRLVAVNNEILGETTSDEKGIARFAPGLTRGTGGQAPALLVAETNGGDYAFLDLTRPAFDLGDRGVEGRPAAGPIDIFAWTERGVYRPGETVHAAAIARDDKVDALGYLPLTFVFLRPDGVEHARVQVNDEGLGGRAHSLPLPPSIQQGTWTLRIFADPQGKALAEESFLVEDYQPERVDFALETSAGAIDPRNPPEISLSANFLYGAPASGQRLEGETIVSPTRKMPKYAGYQFGLEDEDVYSAREPLADGMATDQAGNLSFTPVLPDLAGTSALYEATIAARLVEAGGRFVERRLELPLLADGPRIGIKPAFDGGVDEGGPAEFDVIAVSRDGGRIAADRLEWSLLKLDRRYQWYRLDGRWSFEPITTTSRVANGTLDVASDGAARLSVPVDWGQYRLEIASGGDAPMATSVTFNAGWYVSSASSETPDVLEIGLDKAKYRVGDTAILRLRSRFDGTAVVNVMSDRLIASKVVEVSGDRAEVPLEVTNDWGAGAYVTASLYRPMDLEAKRMPARALGVEWLSVDPAERALSVSIDAPEKMRPRSTLQAGLEIANLKAGEQAFVTLAAVDVGILNLTGYETPDPKAWYFGQRRLGTEIRDLYGQLIDRTAGTRGRVRSGGDGMGLRLDAPPPQEEAMALFSGVVAVDRNGRAQITFDIPDFSGTVRLMAVAWSKSGVGSAERDVIVRDPLVMTASSPRFLAPGDRSRLLVELDNVEGEAADYTFRASVNGPLVLPDGASRMLALDKGERKTVIVPLQATGEEGDGELNIAVEGPDGVHVEKRLSLGVRDNSPDITRRSFVSLAPSGKVTLDAATIAGLKPASALVSVSEGNTARINIPGLLNQLERYPYGCTEQVTSRALPLVYLNEMAVSAGLETESGIRERVEGAISSVLANQGSSGSFGLWSSFGSNDIWLDAYVTDFLLRAGERGYTIPQRPIESALDNIENRIAYASDFSDGGEGIAYGLYVLARAGRASIGDLRYFADEKLGDFASPLAKAQVGAGLALYGETQRAERALRAAVSEVEAQPASLARNDYGTALRDGAGILSYIAEADLDTLDGRGLVSFVADRQNESRGFSTQEMAWLLMAAHELRENARDAEFRIDGRAASAPLMERFTGEMLEGRSVEVENPGAEPTEIVISVTGKPEVPEPAGGEGFAISREIYNLDGNRIEGDAVAQNTRLVVVVKVESTLVQNGRLLVVDRLPAGVVIDNPRLVRAGDVGALDWLDPLSEVEHSEFRDDRFVVAFDQQRANGDSYTFAYMARAASPGVFAHPPATVEDMYQPQFAARTGGGTFEVLGPVR
ncbi:alpha-2-macroglobulin [Stappia sp. GBMRC 2046]|uniref:Alpha-2-macroglobulin n=1 Tax=Stappia sediminis TaxID=2692190 RepID=A0A7X3LY60_9HYPH|nr:alpha-2-macroglobulin family protein [Stappia sediminis]MXN67269.1 alpha-2-macroglobulin [Stappia sediminis]